MDWVGFRKYLCENPVYLLFGVALLLRVVLLVHVPAWEAPDEIAHFQYVRHLCEQRSLPDQIEFADGPDHAWESWQPPLYYLLLTPACWLGSLFRNSLVSLTMMRIMSLTFWIGSSFLLIRWNRQYGKSFGLPVVGFLLLYFFLPSFMMTTVTVNNDNAACFLTVLLFCFFVRNDGKVNPWLWGIFLGLGLLTKLTTVVFFPVVLYRILKQGSFKDILRFVFPCGITGVYILIRNAADFGTLFPEELFNRPVYWSRSLQGFFLSMEKAAQSFWAVAGKHNEHVFCSFAGWILPLAILWGIRKKRESSWLIFESIFLISVQMILLIRFSLKYYQPQGRFLFPLLPWISLFIASALSESKIRIMSTLLLLICACLYTAMIVTIY